MAPNAYISHVIMTFLTKIAKFLFSIYGLLVFVVLLFILFPFIAFSTFFGKIKGGNMIYNICRFWADIAFPLWGFRHRNIYESPHDRNHPVIFVFNHLSYIDIPIIMKAIRKQPVRVLGKSDMAKIPFFGFIYKNAAIMVDRGSPAARAKSMVEMLSFLRKNISIVIAPEGTFNETGHPLKSFFDGAFKLAVETGVPVKPVLFLDGYARLHPADIFSLTPGRSRAVFLEEIPVEGLTKDDVPHLKDLVFKKMEAALIKYEADWILK